MGQLVNFSEGVYLTKSPGLILFDVYCNDIL